jgi:hypothetical protein
MSELAGAAVVFCRVAQFILVALAALFVIGSLMAGMNIIAFAAIGVFALVLLGFVGVVEGVVRLVRGRSA